MPRAKLGLVAALLLTAAGQAGAQCIDTSHMTDAQRRLADGRPCDAFDAIGSWPEAGDPRPLTPAERAAVQRVVRTGLKFPASARFQLGPAVRAAGPYCGYVSGMNLLRDQALYEQFLVIIRPARGAATATLVAIGEGADPLCRLAGY